MSELSEKAAALAKELTRPRFHTPCGQTHVPGPCPEAASVARPEPALTSANAPRCTPSKAVCVRFAPAECERLAAVAAQTGVSIPEVLRLSWFLAERLTEASHA